MSSLSLAVLILAGCSKQFDENNNAPDPGFTTRQNSEFERCSVTPVDDEFWEMVGGVAGEFPVWITSVGQAEWDESKIGPRVLPPMDSPELFEQGYLAKTLIFVDSSVSGDLEITGRRLEDGAPVLFHNAETSTRIDSSTIRLKNSPSISMTIRSANETNRSPNPPGKATHGIGPIFTGPGCWEFTFQIAGYETQVILEYVR